MPTIDMPPIPGEVETPAPINMPMPPAEAPAPPVPPRRMAKQFKDLNLTKRAEMAALFGRAHAFESGSTDPMVPTIALPGESLEDFVTRRMQEWVVEVALGQRAREAMVAAQAAGSDADL